MTTGLVYDVQRFSVHDGPGIRTTAFFKGCPLDCWWCHNPESIAPHPEIIFRPDECIGCGRCAAACPRGLIPGEGGGPGDDAECELCGACCAACPTGALELVGKERTVDGLCQQLERDLIFFDQSGGGVTFSGGEPLAQPEFLRAALAECRRRGLHTAVDTAGAADPEVLEEIADEVDLFLFDIKHTDEQMHEKYVGVSNRGILENLERLVRLRGGEAILARVPLIPGITDSGENLAETGRLLAGLGIGRVHLLPYHRAGTDKYPLVGRTYRLPDLAPPSTAEIAAAREALESRGVCVRTGG